MRVSPANVQRAVVAVLWGLAAITIGVLVFIITYILVYGLPHVTWEFLTQSPENMGRDGGILPMIVATALVAGLGVVIAAPVGVATAIYLTEFTRESWVTRVIRFGADCLAGIPSIILGLFGFVFFCITLGLGYSVISGALTLALMVLPTIIRTTEEAIRAVPHSYREVSYGVGSTRWQMVTHVVLRSALPGIATGVVLSTARCIEETAVLMLTVGGALRLPVSVFDPCRPLSLHFYILAREGLSWPKAFATASVLIIVVLVINLFAYWLTRRFATQGARHG
jgi:phosphate transport system permease protein